MSAEAASFDGRSHLYRYLAVAIVGMGPVQILIGWAIWRAACDRRSRGACSLNTRLPVAARNSPVHTVSRTVSLRVSTATRPGTISDAVTVRVRCRISSGSSRSSDAAGQFRHVRIPSMPLFCSAEQHT